MLIYAHRGARGCRPENTLIAFERALAVAAHGIELDVQLTKDGEVVICHDHTIDRTSNGSGYLSDFTLKELKTLDFGSWFHKRFSGETILTLDEFLSWFAPTPLLLNIEIKNGPVIYENIETKVIALLRHYKVEDRIIISSFYHPSLAKVKQLNPLLKTAVLFDCRPIDVCRFIDDTQANFLHPHWHNLDANWVKLAHAKGIGVNTYTINSIDQYNFVNKLGVDAIFTDQPELFIK